MLARVHMPIVQKGLFTAMVLVFVDVMKELPITLMTRPFGYDTLAVRVFELTSEGLWERASVPALAIVVIGFIPVFLLILGMERKVPNAARAVESTKLATNTINAESAI